LRVPLNRLDRRATTLPLAVLGALYFLYHVTAFKPSRLLATAPFGDAAIMFEVSQRIVTGGGYPVSLGRGVSEFFVYPPAAVMAIGALALAGVHIGFLCWLVSMALGLCVSIRGSLEQEALHLRAAWLAIALPAIAVADYPVHWSLRNAQSDLPYLGLLIGGYATLGRHPVLAGMLFAASASFKIYSGGILGWLFWSRQTKAPIACAATMMALWVALPLVVLGWEGSVRTYGEWIDELRQLRLAAHVSAPVPIVSVRKAAAALTHDDVDARSTSIVVWIVWGIWTAILGWYAHVARRSGRPHAPSRQGLSDVLVIALAPLPFSPILEPYHAVPLLSVAALLVAVLLDRTAARRLVLASAAGLAALVALRIFALPWELRGLNLVGSFAVAVVTLGIVRAGERPPGHA
jgi:hypothetical protein